MLRKAAMWFGIVFLVIGILGFVPALTPDGLLLNIFQVNVWHNIIHIASGIVALLCMGNEKAARTYFQVFGIVYGLVAILGIVDMDGPLLGIVAHNMADMWLHIVITLVSLWLGFGTKMMNNKA